MNNCKKVIPGLDHFKCEHCGWIITEFGIKYLEKEIEKIEKRKKDSEVAKELRKQLRSECFKESKCQAGKKVN